jgi:dATP pyrophosphohydrolase
MNPAYKLPQSVLVVIHTREMQVLLLRRTDMGSWQSVTGSKDAADEAWHSTAVREVHEETGIDALHPHCRLQDWGTRNLGWRQQRKQWRKTARHANDRFWQARNRPAFDEAPF